MDSPQLFDTHNKSVTRTMPAECHAAIVSNVLIFKGSWTGYGKNMRKHLRNSGIVLRGILQFRALYATRVSS
jgi:hypothetical protein